ncbi:ABC transporter substrate-binding protein [Poriferisphaera sp. WC338]|uniref:ABC transporter substrate-binding protein n=1 Tax=Poriferisphaera sp. WC338 TaxID=3425129 RepID=UPI003D817E18
MTQCFYSLICVLVIAGNLFASNDITPTENLFMKQSPILEELVQRGELEVLANRLPEDPMVVPVVEKIGYYGGTWRKFDLTPDFVTMKLMNAYYGLTRWSPDAKTIQPGLASSWEYSEDGRVVTFHLRKGLKWSDGKPFTSDDILFWWELCLHPGHPLSPPDWAYTGGDLMDVRAPNEYTIQFAFQEPFYFVPLIVGTGFWWPETMIQPRHYLSQFHPDQNELYEDFKTFDRKRDTASNPERPTLGPWRLKVYSSTGDRAVYERNPFYWAVDEHGRQLPYIDRIEVIRVQNADAGLMYMISGAVDAQFRQIDIRDYALLKRFADKGNYQIRTWEEGTAAWHAIFINWSVIDAKTKQPNVKRRKLFRDVNFRRGLAVAINRERINQVVWNGLSRPQAAAITDESWHFDSPRGQTIREAWTTRWSEYDVKKANAYLDAAGLSERDAEGFRLYDDERFELRLEFYDEPYAADEAVLIEEDWERVGVRTIARQAVAADLENRRRDGMFDMYMRHNSELDLFTFPAYVFPNESNFWHPLIGKYYATAGKKGEKPVGFMAKLLELYDQTKREPDLARRHELVLDAIDIQLEHGPFMIGTTGRQKSLILLNKHIRNIPDSAILGPWAQCQPASSFPEQFYFDRARLFGEDE